MGERTKKLIRALTRLVTDANTAPAPAPEKKRGVDFAALAERAANGDSGAPRLDYSPGSVLLLDTWIDSILAGGEAPFEDHWEPQDSATRAQILSFGAYLGEVLRRNLGGEWLEGKRVREALIELPNGTEVAPLLRVHGRFKNGRDEQLFPLYRDAAQRVGMPLGPEHARAFVRLGAYWVRLGRPENAAPLYEEALALDPTCSAARDALEMLTSSSSADL